MTGPPNTDELVRFLSGCPIRPARPSYRGMYVTSNSDTCYDAQVLGWVCVLGWGGTRGGGHAAPDVACGGTSRGNDRWEERTLAEHLLAGPRGPSCLLHRVLGAPEGLRPQRPEEPHPVLLRLDQQRARAHDGHRRMGDGRDPHRFALPP